ncbi:DNA-binding transcriptional MerR regulator [Spinactinospora alkalitolerans]|uniref:DNA-binding transcriptional MerR regulator n=1 Tax=Spinactinospora alkalitolerans TaxID=687207 RepID=A0A852TYD6_9ACTN|nr:MerR family transcriptional regulator [Spinactinospora alkalitolerans]NYE47014.1 DNA-binding transcriptional MerR regulator [Spinactinospora alkalitolerans]
MSEGHMQIGEVAERTGLSLRTIRYYGEVGLVEPSARSKGGFRLYTGSDVERLLLIKRMKPLDFSLEETRDLLDVLDRLEAGELGEPERDALLARLDMFSEAAAARCRTLREHLDMAEEFGGRLREQRARHEATA